jgi:hypothetical protein
VFVNTVDDKGFGMGDCEGVTYRNNIFYWRLPGSQVGPQEHGPSAYPKRAVFEANCFAGHEPLVNDPKKLVANPKFVAPGKGGEGRQTAVGYQLQAGSPCLEAGAEIPDNISLDFFGNPVPKQVPPAIGAHQPIVNH